MSTFLFYLIKTGIFTVPFVPTSGGDIRPMLEYLKLKKGMHFVDLGCGDGRVLMQAVRDYGVIGTGVEVNPVLVWYARIWAQIFKISNATFLRKDLYCYSLADADIVYLFLFPRMMERMSVKIKEECKKGTIIVSRGFELPHFKKIHSIPTKSFETFFYRV